MREERTITALRKIIGLALITAGITCAAVQLANGGAQARSVEASPASAQASEAPRIENARLQTQAAGASLAATIRELSERAEQPEWVGYNVDEIAGDHGVCCNNNWNDGNCGTCRLEKENDGAVGAKHIEGAVKLEGSRQLVVLFRWEAKRVVRIRLATADCTLDAGGLPFIWLTGVKAPESVALLAAYVRGSDLEDHGDRGIGNGALTAIALHADASADQALESFVKPDQHEGLRRQAAFWMGAARGKAGLTALQHMAKTEGSSDVRAHVTFALSVSHEAGALDEMIRMARDDASSHVRGQALFWLAQKAGKKAVGTITGAIENDPDTDVKKKAVFALSQLPKDEGVPKLIEVAQTNHNAEVRKQAMFWLGQSNDPRALQFFEKVLTQ
ncbi:MAG TPA: HEAT repeat domain-containing protein [Candidatus Cybelea sp.]|nr:HEAT repeat domain-containing protein [Candidatus Cybelea sp.]